MTAWKHAGEDVEESINDINASIAQQSQLLLNTFRAELSVLQNNLVRAGIILDGANSRIELIGKRVLFKSTDGKTYIQTGTDNNGYPLLEFLSPDGEVAYNLGYTGLTQIIQESIPQSWADLGEWSGFINQRPDGGQSAGTVIACEVITGDSQSQSYRTKQMYMNSSQMVKTNTGWQFPSVAAAEANNKYYLNTNVDSNYIPTSDPVADGWLTQFLSMSGRVYMYRLIYVKDGRKLDTEYTIEIEKLIVESAVTNYHGRIVEEIEGYTPATDDAYIKMPPVPAEAEEPIEEIEE